VVARELSPLITQIAKKSKYLGEFDKQEKVKIEFMISQLEEFKGEMAENSTLPSVYSVWQYFFYRGLLYRYTTESDPKLWNSA
jgi:hypothetical protein